MVGYGYPESNLYLLGLILQVLIHPAARCLSLDPSVYCCCAMIPKVNEIREYPIS